MQDQNSTYRARVQPVTFEYPSTWQPSMQIETTPASQTELGYIDVPGTGRPSMAFFAAGQPAHVDTAEREPEREFTIVTSTPVGIPGLNGPQVYYVEAIIENGDNEGYWVAYGLASDDELINKPQTFRSRRDELPLIVKSAATPNPGEGVLVFSGVIFGFASKELAQSFFQDPLYQKIKATMLTITFVAAPRDPIAFAPVGATPAATEGATAQAPAVAAAGPANSPPLPQEPSAPADVPAAQPGGVITPQAAQPLPSQRGDDDPTTLRIQR
ncbi:MAG TPA: hypothetical protein VLI54_04610 [Bacillota bacterium]|nr:hypothetical protein [Bacillota bacterium]